MKELQQFCICQEGGITGKTFCHQTGGHITYNQAEGLSLSVTNPSEIISLVGIWNQLAAPCHNITCFINKLEMRWSSG